MRLPWERGRQSTGMRRRDRTETDGGGTGTPEFPIKAIGKIMNKRIHRATLAVSAAGILWAEVLPARADQTESLEELKAKIQELDQKVKILERNRELDTEAAEAKAKDSAKIPIGDRGVAFASAD